MKTKVTLIKAAPMGDPIEICVRGYELTLRKEDAKNIALLSKLIAQHMLFVLAYGDDAQLATLLQRCRDEPAMLARLQAQCALRAPRFAPDQERADLRALVRRLLENAR